jgi:glycosyltransferase involved in cell wall biosynthesis
MISEDIESKAKLVLERYRVAVFIVAYNAEKHIEKVFERIPKWVASQLIEIYLIDDSSSDGTVSSAIKLASSWDGCPVKVFKTPTNQGYGGNQKIGYEYAINQNFDIVVLLHGDGQYAPEALPFILAPYAEGANAVFGSRFLNGLGALKGGMPKYKFVGNRILSSIQNFFMQSSLSEWHSGYRSYSVNLLKKIPFQKNSNGFEFDSEIIIQTLGSGFVIREVAIPTFYGDEICHVNGLDYAWKCFKHVLQYRLMQLEIFYDPKFNVHKKNHRASLKVKYKTTLDYFLSRVPINKDQKLLCFGEFSHEFLSGLQRQTDSMAVIARDVNDLSKINSLNNEGLLGGEGYDQVIALDILGRSILPEMLLHQISLSMKSGGKLYASSGNVAFFPIRLMLLLGFFNYSNNGILNLSQIRLFTRHSFARLLRQQNYDILDVKSFGPPICIIPKKQKAIWSLIDWFFNFAAKILPGFFGYQILIIAQKRPSLEYLIHNTTQSLNSAK